MKNLLQTVFKKQLADRRAREEKSISLSDNQEALEMKSPAPNTSVNPPFSRYRNYVVSGDSIGSGEFITVQPSDFLGPGSFAFSVNNYVPGPVDGEPAHGGASSYGIDSYGLCNNAGVAKPGSMNSVQGFVTGDQQYQFGVTGCAFPSYNIVGQTHAVGVSGVAWSPNAEATAIGVYASLIGLGDIVPKVRHETAVLLLDNQSTGKPLIIGRKKNGERVFALDGEGRIQTSAPAGAEPVWLRFGVTPEGKLVVEVNGVLTPL